MADRPTLVVGSSGLLGSSVSTLLGDRALRARVRWSTPDAPGDLAAAANALLASVEDAPWRVMWCAGAGVVGTSQEALDREVEEFAGFLEHLTAAAGDQRGTVFLASSAGGLLAGADGPRPFTEATEPAPLAPYGHAKLAMEQVATRILGDAHQRLAIGRIANLYGPGQNLAKMQGLISHLGRTLVSGSPLGVYVPIDTIRDDLYADDCAAMALAFVETAEERDLAHTTKILASGNGVTIGELIGLLRHLTKRKPHVIYAASKLASAQSSDLRLRSMVLPELNAYATTPLPVGVSATVEGILRQFREGELAS